MKLAGLEKSEIHCNEQADVIVFREETQGLSMFWMQNFVQARAPVMVCIFLHLEKMFEIPYQAGFVCFRANHCYRDILQSAAGL